MNIPNDCDIIIHSPCTHVCDDKCNKELNKDYKPKYLWRVSLTDYKRFHLSTHKWNHVRFDATGSTLEEAMENVIKKYNETDAPKEVSFQVAPSTFFKKKVL